MENEIPAIVNSLIEAMNELGSEFTSTSMEFTRGEKRYCFVCGLHLVHDRKSQDEDEL